MLSIFAAGIALATISQDSGFEGADGNLANNGTFDWNDFKAVTWSTNPAAPYRTSSKTVSGWEFTGLEDAQNDGNDTVFAGGVKQDDSCPSVNLGPKPPNKDDLKRVYIASKKAADDHTYLALAWARIPQNTTSASAHVAFEFNQNDPDVTSCPAGSRGLVPRSIANGGDMLIVYDFEGGNDPVLLKLLRWRNAAVATAGQLCEASGKAPTAAGCWVLQAALSADGNADGKVNTGDAIDEIAPGGNDTLKTQEFGEAVVDLTDAGVFPAQPQAGQCTSFGRMFAVSRSSGNSAQAQMKDLVGPGDIDLSNCGGLTIKKVTDPTNSGADSFPYTTSGGGLSNFSLDTNPTTTDPTDTKAFTGILAGDKYVTEGSTTGWTLTNIACTGTGSANVLYGTGQGAAFNQGTLAGYETGDTTVKVPLAVNDDITCTFTNKKNAKLTITKVTNPAAFVGQAFSFASASSGISSPFLLDTDPSATNPNTTTFNFNGTNYGSKTVTETVPTGWTLTDITCTGATNSGTNPAATVDIQPGSDVTCTFTNTKNARLVITKVTNPAAFVGQAFSFASASSGISSPFLLDTDPSATNPNTTSFSFSTGFGSKTVTETVPTGWTLTNITCTGATNSGVNPSATVDIQPGSDVECTFTNTKNASLTITKVTDPSPAVGQAFSFASASSGISSPFSLDTDPNTGTSNTTTFNFNGTNYGSKTVTETVPTGWTLTNITCTGATNTGTNPAATVNIQPGSVVTCTFTNKRLFRAIVLVCDETTLDLYASQVALGNGTPKTTMGPITAGTLPAQWTGTADEFMAYLCGLDAKFGGLAANPSTPLPDPGPYVFNLRIE